MHKYSPGWPRFAATEESWYNGGVYRRFGWLGSRLLLYKQGRLDSLQQQLEEHEADAATDARGLSAGQTCRVGETHTPDRLDLIMEEIGKELRNYCKCTGSGPATISSPYTSMDWPALISRGTMRAHWSEGYTNN